MTEEVRKLPGGGLWASDGLCFFEERYSNGEAEGPFDSLGAIEESFFFVSSDLFSTFWACSLVFATEVLIFKKSLPLFLDSFGVFSEGLVAVALGVSSVALAEPFAKLVVSVEVVF